jgi:hypothetical protein
MGGSDRVGVFRLHEVTGFASGLVPLKMTVTNSDKMKAVVKVIL